MVQRLNPPFIVPLSVEPCQHYHSLCHVCLSKTEPVNLEGKKKEAVQQHFKFDHRSFIVKHEYNQSICTKRLLLQITWLPPRGQALQLEVLADVDGMEGCWDPRTLTFTGRAWSSSSVSSWSCTWNQDRKIKHVRGGEHLLTRMCHPVKYYCILSI